MLRLLILLLAFWASSVHGANHELFKNCSRIDFCSKLRNLKLNTSSQFAAEIDAFRNNNGIVVIPLSNSKNESLELHISLLEGNKLRIKVLESNHSRYELADVLDKEPGLLTFSYEKNGTSITLFPSNTPHKVVVSSGPPFAVETYYETQLQVVLSGDRLLVENYDTNQAYSFGVSFSEASKLYGLLHHAYDLVLGETADGSQDPFRFRNSDTSQYETASTMALYGSVPVIYGHSAHRTSGIFLHNAAEQWIDISYIGEDPSAYFMVQSGTLDLFILLGPTPTEVVRQYTSLTGVAHLPQLWTLGYHQCRWSYMTQEIVKDVVANMDRHDFPMDAIWLDIDYTDQKKYFTWEPTNFYDPIGLQKNLSSTNRKLVTILDPHIKKDENYPVYAGAKNKYFVKWQNGSDFEGNCWPGLSSYIDFLDPKARDYYAGWYAYDKFHGSTDVLAGVWNDMNEPSVFDDSTEKTLPFDTVHFGNVLHRDIHNIYGFLQTMATHQGLLQRDNSTKRPFILTRSHFAGSQRYTAMWTGDNLCDWEHLAISYAECLTSNILGQVWCGADIGGFEGIPSEELMQRWYQAAVWLPFFRGHATNDTPNREPYTYPENVQKVIRQAIKLRYKHIPVWYELFYEHSQTGDPVIRPLFYHYPEVLDLQTHILLGRDILARPVVEPNVTSIVVQLPGSSEHWYRIDDDSWSIHKGNTSQNLTVNIETSPLYYRAGSIISRKDIERRSTAEMQNDPYTLYVNLDLNNRAKGRLYVDDYTSFLYSTNGSYLHMNLEHDANRNGFQVRLIDGNPKGFTVNIKEIIIHRIENNVVRETKHSVTSDRTSLETINLVKHLLQERSNEIFIPL